mmetsp:Transcript_76017/g.211213  ORF Transcript_76017/g.211213 Transcript_76017/m.211213 type:complete len:204 (+) Transcript_76017:1910-2521(+)
MRILRRFPQIVRKRTVGHPSTGMRSKQKFITRRDTVLSEPATTSRAAASTSRPCSARSSSARSAALGTPSLGIPRTAGASIHVSSCSTFASTEPVVSFSSATTKPPCSTTSQPSGSEPVPPLEPHVASPAVDCLLLHLLLSSGAASARRAAAKRHRNPRQPRPMVVASQGSAGIAAMAATVVEPNAVASLAIPTPSPTSGSWP